MGKRDQQTERGQRVSDFTLKSMCMGDHRRQDERSKGQPRRVL
jgi:hypothetical protein